ncbi:MAG: hypothetical protein WDN72_03990 [Alphaproteobacteria bacterium]
MQILRTDMRYTAQRPAGPRRERRQRRHAGLQGPRPQAADFNAMVSQAAGSPHLGMAQTSASHLPGTLGKARASPSPR